MARSGYITVAIPEELMTEVDKLIEKKVKGYTSRGEFVKDAVRGKLKEVK